MELPKETGSNLAILRPLFCQLGPLTRCDGSAQLNQGGTTIICGVYGPAEIRPHKEKLEKATVEVSIIPKIGRSGVEDRAKEHFMSQIISASVLSSLHPRNGLHIGLQVLEDDGGNASCAVNTACLALIDSGFPMKCVFAGVTCAVIKETPGQHSVIALDPDSVRLRRAVEINALITFVFESRKKDILASHVTGKCSEEIFQECLTTSKNASDKIFQFYRDVVERKFSKECE